MWPGVIVLSVITPWVFGIALVCRLTAGTPFRNVWLLVGHGYFVGLFFTTLVLRILDLAGVELRALPVASILLLATAALSTSCYLGQRRASPVPQPGITSEPPWQTLLAILLLALIGLRFLTVGQEALLRPLFAWDAWMNWSPKAILYFYSGELVEFTRPKLWLAQAEDASLYTLGNSAAWKYPITVPLIQYWGMLSAGTHETSLAYIHWPLLPLGLGLALFGHLRLAGVRTLLSLLACYALLSLPYINVHSALVGYADLWLAASFGLGVFAIYAWHRHKSLPYAALAIAYAAVCASLKNPGIIACAILLVCFTVASMNLSNRSLIVLAVLAALASATILHLGINMDVPVLGRVSLAADRIELPLLGNFRLRFHPVQGAFLQTIFQSMNWHLLWPLFLLLAASASVTRQSDHSQRFVLLAVLLLLVFIAVVFFFTKYHRAATSFVTLNRALLYAVPAMVFYIFLRIHTLVASGQNKRERN